MSTQLSLTERLRQIEADEFMQLLISSKKKGGTFKEFMLSLSTKPCGDGVVVNNLEFLWQACMEYNYEEAEVTLNYFYYRNTIFLNIKDIQWHLLDTTK